MIRKNNEILYESTPVSRIGVREDDDHVVATTDFSCFVYMLEEYISHGVVSVCIPESLPECSLLEKMPSLLRNCVRVVDDSVEIESSLRVLHSVRRDLGIGFSERGRHLIFNENIPLDIRQSLLKLHSDVKRLSLGINQELQIEINTRGAVLVCRRLRGLMSDLRGRAVLSQLEGVFRAYRDIEFEGNSLATKNKYEILDAFSRITVDPDYLQLSESISELRVSESRKKTLRKINDITKVIRAKEALSFGWNYVTNIVKVFTGFPLPNSEDILKIFRNRSFPTIVDMSESRERAIEMWMNSSASSRPLNINSDSPESDRVLWVPPLQSMRVGLMYESDSCIGTVADILDQLRTIQRARGKDL